MMDASNNRYRFYRESKKEREMVRTETIILDVFAHSAPLVTEISLAIFEARRQITQIRIGRDHRDLAAMATATDQLLTLLRQSLNMTASLRNVLEFHRARRCGND